MFTLKNSISPKFKTAISAISPKFKMPISAISPKFGGVFASDFRQISEILPPISDKSVDEMLPNIVNRFVVWLMCRNFVG